MVQGVYRQWLVDNHPEALEFSVLDIIARYTLGYRKRYAYIKQEKFLKSQPSTWRQVKKAENLGLLEHIRTRNLTMYKLILPDEIENNTQWVKAGTIPDKTSQPELTAAKIKEITKKSGWK